MSQCKYWDTVPAPVGHSGLCFDGEISMTQQQPTQVYTYNDILALLRVRHMELKNMADSFNALQQEIAALEARAPYDPLAAAQVRKVHARLNSDLKTLPQEMTQQAERYVRELKRLQALMRSAFPKPAVAFSMSSATPVKPVGIKKKMSLV